MTTPQRITLVRHGEGFHNATRRYTNRDPFLTEEGQNQARSLCGHASLVDCELLVVSPLSRAVQTAALIFGEKPKCRVCLSPVACERWSGRCDEGRRKSELAGSLPFVASWGGFCDLAENWTPTKSDDATWLTQRVPTLLAWIRAQPERHVVVVGHGAFFQGLIGKYLGNCEFGHVPDVPALFKQLQDPEVSVRHAAAAALADMGKALTSWVDELPKILSNKDPELRAHMVRALGKIGGAVPDRNQSATIAAQISQLLGDSKAGVRSKAAEALGDLAEGASDQIKKLTSKLRDVDPEVRQSAAWALGQILRKKRTEPRWPMQQNGDVEDQRVSVDVAAQNGARKRRRTVLASKSAAMQVAEKMVPLLRDSDKGVRGYALEALGYLCEAPTGCAASVAKFLHDKNSEVRANAGWTLGQIGSAAHPFASKVASLLQDPEASVQYFAVEALGEMGEAAAPYAGKVAEMLRHLDEDFRQVAVVALGNMGQAGVCFASALLGRFEDSDAWVRQYAVSSVGKVAKSSRSAAERNIKLLQAEQDTEVQVKCLQVLGQMGLTATPFSQAVADFLNAPEAAVRLAAAVALGHMQEASTFKTEIAEVLQNPEIRKFAKEQGSKEEKLFCDLVGKST